MKKQYRQGNLEISHIKAKITMIIYSDISKTSQYFIPKMWIKWNGKDRVIKLKTFLGQTVMVTEKELREMNLKMITLRWGKKDIKLMDYNKPYRFNNRIPLLAISKQLEKKIGRLSIDVRKESKQRARRYYGWTG